MEQLICTHCGHHFEQEAAESVICPNCFWSTSVKREREAVQPTPQKETVPASPVEGHSPKFLFWAGGGLFGLLLVGILFFAARYLQKQDQILETIQTQNSQVIATQAPELALPPREQAILSRRVSVRPAQEMSESEKNILSRRVPFRTPLTRGLSTPPWTEQEFEAFLKGEELHYRLPLERSYRRKLKQAFKEHDLLASQAFDAKDYLKARDEWIRALMFPIYRGDIQKHRGVILTMLRPYINDVLSKIGMMNSLLTQKDLFAKEIQIQEAYGALQDLLQKTAWEEAGAQILELESALKEVEGAPKSVNPPPLPEGIALVDSDIREVLLAQVAPAQSSSPDWEALRGDLALKSKIIQAQMPEALEVVQKQYEEALRLIETQNWREAKKILGKIDFPEELAEDAKAKVKILNPWIEKQKGAGPGPQPLDS